MAGFLTDALTAQLAVQAFAELEAGRDEAAVRRLQGATLARPQVVDGFYYLGDMLNRLGRNLEAERVLRRAVALNPCAEVRLGLAFVLMCQGRYPEGWALYRARHEIAGAGLPRAADFPYPEWTGQELSGKHLVIFPEQGFGDQIQFARFVPQLLARGAEVTLLCRPGLERLLCDSLPDARVLAAAGAVEFPDPDYWAMVGGLVGPLGTTLETVPGDPYLTTGATWPALAPGRKIGLMTKGSPTQAKDRARSLPSDVAARLAASLPGQVIDLDPALTGAKDFAQTAALIRQLDLVVTVDTSVAHLAGGMGKPCWVLLSHLGIDWRWLRDRTDSPWYPSVRLFRQGPDLDWGPVIAQVASEGAGI